MIRTAAIASGSNGNCYFFEDDNDAILVDAGVSCKQILSRMENLGLSMDKVRGIFVTHEHIDHVRGIDVLSRKFEIPVYATRNTYDSLKFEVKDELLNFITPKKNTKIGGIEVFPFAKRHDAIEPCSFMLSSEGKNVSVMTDIGIQCDNVIKYLQHSDAVFLESNYDEDMLKNGHYPYFLKKRVGGDDGHLSNYQASLLVLEHALPRLKHVFLSHLSGNNNTPELAQKTFTGFLKQRNDMKVKTMMTSRQKESELLCLD